MARGNITDTRTQLIPITRVPIPMLHSLGGLVEAQLKRARLKALTRPVQLLSSQKFGQPSGKLFTLIAFLTDVVGCMVLQ